MDFARMLRYSISSVTPPYDDADAMTRRAQARVSVMWLRALALYGLNLLGLSSCIVAIAPYGSSQSTSATVNGTVTDQSGAVVSGAQIVLANIDTGVWHIAPTGSAGVYSLSNIPPGKYSARISKDGFATQERTDL